MAQWLAQTVKSMRPVPAYDLPTATAIITTPMSQHFIQSAEQTAQEIEFWRDYIRWWQAKTGEPVAARVIEALAAAESRAQRQREDEAAARHEPGLPCILPPPQDTIKPETRNDPSNPPGPEPACLPAVGHARKLQHKLTDHPVLRRPDGSGKD
jgi:hypothetical protein